MDEESKQTTKRNIEDSFKVFEEILSLLDKIVVNENIPATFSGEGEENQNETST